MEPGFPTSLQLTGLFLYVRLDCVQSLLFPSLPPFSTLTLVFSDFLLWVRREAKVPTSQVSSKGMTLVSSPDTGRSTL